MNVINLLGQADRALFYYINKELSFNWLDNSMLIVRQAFTWIPLYFFFLLFFYDNCRKYFFPIVLFTLVTFAMSDFTSASILKPLIGRLRPCHDPSLELTIKHLAACGGLFSMPSSHAANHFGLAAFWFLVINRTLNQKWYWLWLWAFVIGYSQIYAGVHFPADIIAGAALGTAIGYFTYYLFLQRVMNLNNKTNTIL